MTFNRLLLGEPHVWKRGMAPPRFYMPDGGTTLFFTVGKGEKFCGGGIPVTI
jgi:hypothetical protein